MLATWWKKTQWYLVRHIRCHAMLKSLLASSSYTGLSLKTVAPLKLMEVIISRLPSYAWPAVSIVEHTYPSKMLYFLWSALCNGANHIYLRPLVCSSFFFFFLSSPNLRLSRRRLDVCHTSTHGVALVRISDAGLKPAAGGSLKTQDAKKLPKIAVGAPSHNFVGLYLHN